MVSENNTLDVTKIKDFNSNNGIKNKKTTYQFNHRLLIISLIILAFIGTTYFWLDERVEFFGLGWILIFLMWYVWLIVSLFFIFSRKKLGYLLGGILAWVTIGFLLLDNFHTVFGTSVIALKPSLNITVKNFIEIIVACLSVFSAHNSFHKFKMT